MTERKKSRALANGNLEEIAQLLRPVALATLCENPLVSVLTGNYNYARYLGEAIESVLGQTYTKFEMIVCDDGSTDESCEVVEHYVKRDPRVQLLTKQNGGQASAWNTAYRESKGEIVCFLDADDRYMPQKLETVVQAFRSHPDSGFVGHRMFRTDADGRRHGFIPSIADPPSGWYGPFVVRHGGNPPGLAFSSALCLRREISNLIFPLSETFRSCADGVVMVLAPLMTPLIGIPVPLGEYRHHGSNLWFSPHVTCESLDRELQIDGMFWEVRNEYLESVHPRLTQVFPTLDQTVGALVRNYVQGRLRTSGGELAAYQNMVRAESFLTLHPAARWFWRLSVLLPRPLFRHALGPNRLRQLFWRAAVARRRLFAA